MQEKEIVPGMMGTMCVGTDRYPFIVLKVISPKKIVITHIKDEHYHAYKDGKMTGEDILKDSFYARSIPHTYYEHHYFTLRKNGRWTEKNSSMNDSVTLNFRFVDLYMDPAF